MVYRLKEKYGLFEHGDKDDPVPYADEEFRKIAGVRYEMDRRGFSMSVPYTFATDIKIETVPKIKERSFELPGVDVVESTIRQYVSGTVAPTSSARPVRSTRSSGTRPARCRTPTARCPPRSANAPTRWTT